MTEEYSLQGNNNQLISSENSLEQTYSKDQVLSMFKIYTELAYTVGWARGLGIDLHEPSLKALDMLLALKEKTDTLPTELKQTVPGLFNDLESIIARCRQMAPPKLDEDVVYSYAGKPFLIISKDK